MIKRNAASSPARRHTHFEIAPGIRVIGDPNMKRQTSEALIEMIEIARKSFNSPVIPEIGIASKVTEEKK